MDFILQRVRESHRRSRWMVHTRPSTAGLNDSKNPTDEVGGWFIPNLQIIDRNTTTLPGKAWLDSEKVRYEQSTDFFGGIPHSLESGL